MSTLKRRLEKVEAKSAEDRFASLTDEELEARLESRAAQLRREYEHLLATDPESPEAPLARAILDEPDTDKWLSLFAQFVETHEWD